MIWFANRVWLALMAAFVAFALPVPDTAVAQAQAAGNTETAWGRNAGPSIYVGSLDSSAWLVRLEPGSRRGVLYSLSGNAQLCALHIEPGMFFRTTPTSVQEIQFQGQLTENGFAGVLNVEGSNGHDGRDAGRVRFSRVTANGSALAQWEGDYSRYSRRTGGAVRADGIPEIILLPDGDSLLVIVASGDSSGMPLFGVGATTLKDTLRFRAGTRYLTGILRGKRLILSTGDSLTRRSSVDEALSSRPRHGCPR
jgi:hypothetical protein